MSAHDTHDEASAAWERDDDRIRRVVTADSYPDAIALVVPLGFRAAPTPTSPCRGPS